MLKPRITPCLLVQNNGLVKTVQFKEPKYVGDPLNAVKIFNEKEVDELIVLDIDATARQCEPNFEMIRCLARECRMPFCYGGGVKTLEHMERIIALGVEKVAISSVFIEKPQLVSEASKRIGSQSIVVVLDVKKTTFSRQYEVMTHNGSRKTRCKALDLVRSAEEHGAGEVVINSIDRDGKMTGYDFELIQAIKEQVSIPITVLGGAGSLADIHHLFDTFGILGAGVGSLFVFKGKYRAVLINYPSQEDKVCVV